jgi:hypothetical protein
MLATILSRCQKFDFKRLQVAEIIKKLEFISKKENVKFDASALSLIALNSRGSFRDAESLLDECLSFSGEKGEIKTQDIKELLGIVEVNEISKFVDFLISKKSKDSIVFLNTIFILLYSPTGKSFEVNKNSSTNLSSLFPPILYHLKSSGMPPAFMPKPSLLTSPRIPPSPPTPISTPPPMSYPELRVTLKVSKPAPSRSSRIIRLMGHAR